MSLWAFRFLLFYICILFVQPQNRFLFLYPLHIADLSIMAAVGLHVLASMQERRPLICFGPATKLGLGLLLASFASLFVGPMQTSSAWNPYIDIIAKNTLVLILVEAMAYSVERVWAVLATMLIASLWWIKAGLRLSFAGATYSDDRIMGGAVSLIENPNGFAYMMCLLIPVYLYFYQQAGRPYLRLFFLGLALSAVYIVFQTGSRTGMMILILLSFFLFPKYAAKHKVTILVTVVAILTIWSLVAGGNIRRFKSIPQSIRSFLSGEIKSGEVSQDEQSAQERRLKNRDTWRLIKEYPVFGIGVCPDEALIVQRFPGATGQVHNEILMSGRMMGVIGMSLYAGLLAVIYRRGRQAQWHTASWWPGISDLGWTFSMQAIVFAVGGFFSPIPFNPPMMILAGSASALWAHLQESTPRVPENVAVQELNSGPPPSHLAAAPDRRPVT